MPADPMSSVASALKFGNCKTVISGELSTFWVYRNAVYGSRGEGCPRHSTDAGAPSPVCYIRDVRTCPGGETGRRNGLKIRFPATGVRVRFPPRAPFRIIDL